MISYDDLIDPETHPIMYYQWEWDHIARRNGRLDCPHIWLWRRGRPVEEFVLLARGGAVVYGVPEGEGVRPLPGGRVCLGCGRVEFEPLCGPPPEGCVAKWQQHDFDAP